MNEDMPDVNAMVMLMAIPYGADDEERMAGKDADAIIPWTYDTRSCKYVGHHSC